MRDFVYRGGALHAEDVDLKRIAREVGTPFYCYSSAAIERRFRLFSAAFADRDALVCYAVKANSNQAVLKTLARMGAGMDVVSEGELRRARAAGAPADKIVFSGVGKTRGEMALALEEDILCFNVESEPELAALSEVASARGRIARVAIRVNPDIAAGAHAKIATGRSENKFGVPISRARAVYARAVNDSSAWQSTSKPLAATTIAGSVRVTVGSTSACVGRSRRDAMPVFARMAT